MEKRSSSVFRIDERVFYSMGLVAIVCIVILGFRYKSYEPCEAIVLKMNAANFYTKSLISFKAETKSGNRYEWYFGDSASAEAGGSSITHAYQNAGRYTVKVKINGKCEQLINVDIRETPIVVIPGLIPIMEAPDSALINVPVTFKDKTPDASSWEWRFGNSKVIESTTREASYTFTTEGHQQVYLRINGRFDRYLVRDIYVKDPKPLDENANGSTSRKKAGAPVVLPPLKLRPENPPLDQGGPPKAEAPKVEAKLKVRDITPDEISVLLEGVVAAKKDAPDFAEYLCGDLNITVKYNNKSMSFARMCNELKKFKKVKNINKPLVVLGKDKETNCIKAMDVTVNKKGLLDRIGL